LEVSIAHPRTIWLGQIILGGGGLGSGPGLGWLHKEGIVETYRYQAWVMMKCFLCML
jgi:hypothetical protein